MYVPYVLCLLFQYYPLTSNHKIQNTYLVFIHFFPRDTNIKQPYVSICLLLYACALVSSPRVLDCKYFNLLTLYGLLVRWTCFCSDGLRVIVTNAQYRDDLQLQLPLSDWRAWQQRGARHSSESTLWYPILLILYMWMFVRMYVCLFDIEIDYSLEKQIV